MDITSRKLVGKPGVDSGVYFVEKEASFGAKIFCIILVRGFGDHQRVANNFFAYVENKVIKDIYSSLENIKRGLALDSRFIGIEFCVCICQEKKLFCLAGGGGELSVIRKEAFVTLLKTEVGASTILSGHILEGDKYILSTKKTEVPLHKNGIVSGDFNILKEELDLENKSDRGLIVLEIGSTTEPDNYTPPAVKVRQISLKEKVTEIIDKVLSKLPERNIIVNGPEVKSTKAKRAALVGIIFMLILGISIYIGLAKRTDSLRREEYEPRLLSAIHDYNESLELSSLSKTRARELILSSRSTASELKNSGVEDERLTKLFDDISGSIGPIAGIYGKEAELYMDLSIISNSFEGSDISLSGDELRVLDSKGKRLVGIKVENKKTEIIAGPDYFPDALKTAAYTDRSFILSTDGIREVTDEVSLTIKSDWEPEKVLISAFAGNIYVLDKGNNQIWRYPGVRGGFLEKESWLAEGYNISLENVVDWSIDGAVWTVTNEGRVNFYVAGAPNTLSISGVNGTFNGVEALYTDEESEYLYILDKGNGRIAIVTKEGDYVGEYVSSEISSATDIAVYEKDKMVLFLANSKLYKLSANHLERVDSEDN